MSYSNHYNYQVAVIFAILLGGMLLLGLVVGGIYFVCVNNLRSSQFGSPDSCQRVVALHAAAAVLHTGTARHSDQGGRVRARCTISPTPARCYLHPGTVWLHPEHTRRVRSADQSSVISSVVRLRKSAALQLSVLRLVHTACTYRQCLFRAPAKGILNGIPSSVLHMTNLNLRNGRNRSRHISAFPLQYTSPTLPYCEFSTSCQIDLTSSRKPHLGNSLRREQLSKLFLPPFLIPPQHF